VSANVEHIVAGDAMTRAILPAFVAAGRPFVLVFWCGDPDQTQHAHGDRPEFAHARYQRTHLARGRRNADAVLGQLVGFVDAQPALRDNTDIVVTSDHGFSTTADMKSTTGRHVTKQLCGWIQLPRPHRASGGEPGVPAAGRARDRSRLTPSGCRSMRPTRR